MPEANIQLHTGEGGADRFEEMLELQNGRERVYIGYKVPRYLRRTIKKIRRSHSGRYFFTRKAPGKSLTIDLQALPELTNRELIEKIQEQGIMPIKSKPLTVDLIELAICDLFQYRT
jgi:hypothetical protein